MRRFSERTTTLIFLFMYVFVVRTQYESGKHYLSRCSSHANLLIAKRKQKTLLWTSASPMRILDTDCCFVGMGLISVLSWPKPMPSRYKAAPQGCQMPVLAIGRQLENWTLWLLWNIYTSEVHGEGWREEFLSKRRCSYWQTQMPWPVVLCDTCNSCGCTMQCPR